TGLQSAKAGRRTCVCLSWPASPSCDVLVVDTDSRNRLATAARRRVHGAARALRAAGVERFYKKIDSTGRGNVGAEIDAMAAEVNADLILVCPAFPPLGRTVRDGRILVRGVPLDQTEFASDPLWPSRTAKIETILRRQSTLPIAHLSIDEIRRGPGAVAAQLDRLPADGRLVVVADAETAGDLRCLAEAMGRSDARILPAGSAGLAEWL